MSANVCTISDLISGGSILPHVYCKNISLENGPEEGSTNVILNLEILQSKKELNKKNYLSELTPFGSSYSFSDYINIQIVPFRNTLNIQRLDPTYNTDSTEHPGNAYVQSSFPAGLTQNHYPWKVIDEWGESTQAGSIYSSEHAYWSSDAGMRLFPLSDFLQPSSPEKPTSSYVREETISGVSYYVISFEQVFTYSEALTITNLGFLFYAWLDPRKFVEDMNPDLSNIDLLTDKHLTGPVNTEIVLLGNEVQTTRKQFFLPNGNRWNGAVHLHLCDLNPAPDGYCGTGQALGGPAGPDASDTGYQGWMAGEKHVKDAPRLRLMQTPNNMIQDFRTESPWLDTAMGLTNAESNEFLGKSFNQQIHVFSQNQDANWLYKHVISPFQKETKKYLTKIDNAPGPLDRIVPLYDNDSEFSKLYMSRDKDNNARGTFLINFERLLRNNSVLYNMLDGPAAATNFKMQQCLAFSQLLELKVYRDRVQKRPQGKTYEKYANDTSYEEPSYYVGTVRDSNPGADTSWSIDGALRVVNLETPYSDTTINNIKCFTFKDTDVGEKSAGLYQYRIEMSYKDGTYYMLNSLLKNLVIARFTMQKYYDFSLGSYVVPGILHPEHPDDSVYLPGEHPDDTKTPARIHPYFLGNNTFDPQFEEAASTRFPDKPWLGADAPNPEMTIWYLINQVAYNLFDLKVNGLSINPDNFKMAMASLTSPVNGSPQGIEFVIKLTDSIIGHLHKLLGAKKVNKTGSEIDATSIPFDSQAGTAYNLSTFPSYNITPSTSTIKEYHTFDGPSELHKALSNEDIYIDYLSQHQNSTADYNPGWVGTYQLSYASYLIREQHDSVRMYASTADPLIYNGAMAAGQFTVNEQNDSFSQSVGYLMPSIIELSDPSEEDTSFKFKTHFFKTNGLVTPSITYEDYDKILVALMLYNINKDNANDADLLDALYSPTTASDTSLKEAYKSLYSSAGIVIYDENKYAQFLAKEPNNLLELVPCDPEDADYQECLDDYLPEYPTEFSDGDLETEKYYKQFFSDPNSIYKTPVGKINVPYNKEMPNIFKLVRFVDDPGLGGSTLLESENQSGATNAPFIEAINATKQGMIPKYNSFFFINANLLAKIQVYTGIHHTSSPMKHDDYSWEKLSGGHLSGLTIGESLLCRIKLYDERAAYGLELPIINKYFFIYKNI